MLNIAFSLVKTESLMKANLSTLARANNIITNRSSTRPYITHILLTLNSLPDPMLRAQSQFLTF